MNSQENPNPTQAFDHLAPSYDDTFSNTRIGQYLRRRIQSRLVGYFQAGQHVLELGCGTGEDALFLAGRAVHITATDVSAAMLEVVRAKAVGNPFVSTAQLDLSRLPQATDFIASHTAEAQFDGVFSNFGALNCLEDWRPLAAWLAEVVKPGSIVAFGVMSPLCLWEPLWHGLHLDFKTATRRWRKNTVFQPDQSSRSISVKYPSIHRITQDFTPYFHRLHVEGIGLFLPPSDVFGAIEKRPRLLDILMGLEARFGKYSALALLADHFWIEFQRTKG